MSVKIEIDGMKEQFLSVVAEVGMMAENLKEAAEWAGDDRQEEVALSLESVAAGAEAIVESLRAIALKSAEICDRKAPRK